MAENRGELWNKFCVKPWIKQPLPPPYIKIPILCNILIAKNILGILMRGIFFLVFYN